MSDIHYVYIFSIIGIAILLVACINFINLTTARSAERFKEIGVRKVMGAVRTNLVIQFITESMVVTILASILAALVTTAIIPALGHFTGKQLSLARLVDPLFLSAFGLIILAVGLISGSYPAFILSSQEPVKVLKTNTGKFSGNAFLRKTLVVVQFMVSVILISGTIIVLATMVYLYTRLSFVMKMIIASQ